MKICNKKIKMQIKNLGLPFFFLKQILDVVCWLDTNAKEKLCNNTCSTIYTQEKQRVF